MVDSSIGSYAGAGVNSPLPNLQDVIVPGRSCGTCTLCCKLPAIPDFHKPRSVLCSHCVPNRGCSIHSKRPSICREFFCNWLLNASLGAEWQPERCHMVLQSAAMPGGHQCLAIQVDPAVPDAWLSAPYYVQIKRWAAKAAQQQTGPVYFVLLEIENRKFLVLPDREIDLGEFDEGDSVEIERNVTGNAVSFIARKAVRTIA